jgi:hypothetical protein
MSEPRPSAVKSYLLLGLALAAVAFCLAAAGVERAAERMHPLWRADEFAEPWLPVLLWVGGLLAASALVLLLARVAGAPSARPSLGLVGITLALAVVSFLGLAATGSAHLRRFHRRSRKTQCLSNVKTVALALNMYATDYQVFPAPNRWSDLLDDYVKNPGVYRCTDEPELRCAFAYNDRLAGVGLDLLANADKTISVFESDSGWNAHGGSDLLPYYPRHVTGDNYGFADGSVRWWARKSKTISGRPEPQWLKAPKDPSLIWEPKLQSQGPPEGTHD